MSTLTIIFHSKKSDYILDLEAMAEAGGVFAELPTLYKIARFCIPGLTKRFDGVFERVSDYGQKAVRQAKSDQLGSANIFSGMVSGNKQDDSAISEKGCSNQASALIVAGSGTTAVTLTYLVWAVLSRPEICKKLTEEVCQLPEGYDDSTLELCPYLSAVILETLRLYGSAPGGLPRNVPSGGFDACGYHIPGGTVVSTQSYTLHRNASVWESPEE